MSLTPTQRKKWHVMLKDMNGIGRRMYFDGYFRMKTEHWIVGVGPTIADIACFPYVALSGDGGIPLDDYHAIRRWIARVKQIPGFIVMPGIHAN